MERVQRFQIVPESALVPGFQRPFPLPPALSPEEREKAPSGRTAASIQFLDSFGHAGTGPGAFNRPEGLCVDAQDRVYIAESCNPGIQIFSSDGKSLHTYGKAGSAKGELSYSYRMGVD